MIEIKDSTPTEIKIASTTKAGLVLELGNASKVIKRMILAEGVDRKEADTSILRAVEFALKEVDHE